ncbi:MULTISPECIES: Abi family protein [Pseudomonadota]|uniref:Abi family protein n=1 Tax=Pseudomonadota TaxID=1224 RepID=UPI00257494FA|nr:MULTISPECIES: Abi family protein [Pseudomonadota]MDM1716620.1 Abi family protein [Thiopseudomonas alkaliphila]
MIPFNKPVIDVSQQLALLEQRGLIIKNPEKAAHYLEVISYFRLSAYMRPFQQPNDDQHRFYPQTEFKQIVALYAFDRELRLLLLDAIERIEVAIRSMLNIVMGKKNEDSNKPHSGSHWYLDRQNFKQQYRHSKLLEEFENIVEKEQQILDREQQKLLKGRLAEAKKKIIFDLKRRENYCRYYTTKYFPPKLPPGWALIEELSLGSLSHLYSGLAEDSDRKAIAQRFNTPQDKLGSWLHTLTFIRNCCAHHARLWNRELSIAPALMRDSEWKFPTVLPNSHIQPAKRLYVVILLIVHLMQQVSPNSNWAGMFVMLLNKYPDVPLRNMGFPDDWQQHPFFTESRNSD